MIEVLEKNTCLTGYDENSRQTFDKYWKEVSSVSEADGESRKRWKRLDYVDLLLGCSVSGFVVKDLQLSIDLCSAVYNTGLVVWEMVVTFPDVMAPFEIINIIRVLSDLYKHIKMLASHQPCHFRECCHMPKQPRSLFVPGDKSMGQAKPLHPTDMFCEYQIFYALKVSHIL